MPPCSVHVKACLAMSPGNELVPTTVPLSLTPRAKLALPPKVPMSIIPALRVHTNACVVVSPGNELKPTTIPLPLIARAAL